MNESIINEICHKHFKKYPDKIKLFEMGYGNYVYKINFNENSFIMRTSFGTEAYKDMIYWLNKLMPLNLPIPKILSNGIYGNFSYLILSYIEGEDLGNVYNTLSNPEKKIIAQDIVSIQNKVSTLPLNNGYGYLTSYEDKNFKNNWKEVITDHLNRSEIRIEENKVFDYSKVIKIKTLLYLYDDYFNSIKPIPFLDDLSSKNILINKGKVSGIIDFDWICFGDRIYYIALTNMALIAYQYDTKYIDYLMEEMNASDIEKDILKLYTLIFCVDFMSEKGMKFKDKVVEVTKNEIEYLNNVYEKIYNELIDNFKL